jgi:predicted NAD-dependent protein-ADP-ribosyltransferase YbiA (DUF1768 family)
MISVNNFPHVVHYIDLNTGSNSFRISPFKFEGHGDGAFINTTKKNAQYSVTQTITLPNSIPRTLTWPSSEHAFHAQKVIDYIMKNPGDKEILAPMLDDIINAKLVNDEFLPRDCYDPIAIKYANLMKLSPENGDRFDWAIAKKFEASNQNPAHVALNRKRMERVLKLKCDQHPGLKEKAKLYALHRIMPIEVSRYDETWASGGRGSGSNVLGILILELGNAYLAAEGRSHEITIQDPSQYYADNFLNKLEVAHDNLEGYCNGSRSLNAIGNNSQVVNAARNKVIDAIKQKFDVDVQSIKVGDSLDGAQKVIKLEFKNYENANRFAIQNRGSYRLIQAGNFVILGTTKDNRGMSKADYVFKGLGLPSDITDGVMTECDNAPQPSDSEIVSNDDNIFDPDVVFQYHNLRQSGVAPANNQPQFGFQQPQPGYGYQPQFGFQQPQPGYGYQPQFGFQQPQPGYGYQPQFSYQQQQPGYSSQGFYQQSSAVQARTPYMHTLCSKVMAALNVNCKPSMIIENHDGKISLCYEKNQQGFMARDFFDGYFGLGIQEADNMYVKQTMPISDFNQLMFYLKIDVGDNRPRF